MSNVYNLINQLDSAVNSFEGKVNVHVRNVDTTTQRIQATTGQVYQKVQQFRNDLMKGEEKQIAHENIIRLDQVVKEQFGNYEEIRKTIIGVVRDFDINLVRNDTIEELSEELWITSSRYWLSYALIAITAWVNNYPDVARNALSESARKDAIKTSLFFCLLNLRFDRVETAKNWFKVYCRTLDPTMLQQETAVMIQAFLNGIFGKDKELEHEVLSILDEWIAIISDNARICEELVQAYVTYLDNLGKGAEFNYEFINAFCTNSDELKKSFEDASKFDRILAVINSMDVESVPQNNENYKSRVDAVLINLISNYDQEELEIKNQQQYYRLVVENEGDIKVAEAQYAQFQALQNESFNIGKQMVEWVTYGDRTNTDVQVRKFALQSTKEWFRSAINKWTSSLKTNCPLSYGISIDGWSCISNARDLDEQVLSMKNYYENNKFKMVCINNFNIAAVIVFLIALAITVGSIVSVVKHGFTPALIVGIVLMLASAGFVAFRIMSGLKAFAARVETNVRNLQMTIAQIVEFQRFFTANINKTDDILSKLEYI
ncbi:hypothetical protein SAMN02910436_02502 [Ruminococcaceae bacterium P7]|nr:hypothetical protein SAMN02910436_02502 [Ruminococcaceae bacterium P7]